MPTILTPLVVVLCLIIFSNTAAQTPPKAWINEFHYDNEGTDTDEFVEIAVDSSFKELTSLTLYLYNGSNGSAYGDHKLDTFTKGSTEFGITFYYKMIPGIQNGAPDGMALFYNDKLVDGQFLSYEGVLTASDGPAAGLSSTDILVEESSSTPAGFSLGLIGKGEEYSSFEWKDSLIATPGKQNGDQVVPVELNYFEAAPEDDHILLKWETGSENNNFGFEVQKLVNNNWKKICFLPGSGTSVSPKNYNFTDSDLLPGSTYFYRLKQLDYNGSFSYSKTIKIYYNRTLLFQLFQNYPNPFNPVTEIQFVVPVSEIVNISLFNLLGQKIKELINKSLEAGSHSIDVNLDGLNSGIYLYKITAGEHTAVKKMILLK